ncbi:MAG: tripartite tricarboxylate transporter substrate binding protein [Bryobacteraceae bacterium]
MTRRHALAAVLSLAGCSHDTGPYPSREIRLIVQAAPGGLSDTVSRIAASIMEKELGVPVVCENKPGAAGALAFSYVARQAPDGYTIGHAAVELTMVRSLGFANVGPEDTDLLALVSKAQPAIAVLPDSPWRTLADFVEATRAKPGYYVVGNSGTGSIWHINALLLERNARAPLIHCPFSGSSGSITALLGGHIDAAVAAAGELIPQVKAGRVRVLAVFGKQRSPVMPEAAASAEQGYDFGADAWSGFYAPRGLDPAVRAKLTKAVASAFASDAFQQVCRERGLEPALLEAGAFDAFARKEAAFYDGTLPSLLRGEPGEKP